MADKALQKAFGDVVRDLRTQAGLSQEQLAFAAERHFTYVSLIERGRNAPSITTVWRLARALDVAPSEMLRSVERKLAAGEVRHGGAEEASG